MSLQTILLALPFLSILIACTMTEPTGELTEDHLRPCPKRPNCVTSDSDTSSSITPISFYKSPEEAWQQMQLLIQEQGGEICEMSTTYLHATFTSTFFGFIDDMELRMEPQTNLIHIRSGARVGYFDFGVNKKRIEKIRKLFAEQPSGQKE
jgi:uncharacterized protein (DUF1499 family)